METININLIPNGVAPKLHASQFDKNLRVFGFYVNYGSEPYDLTGKVVAFNMRKPDNNIVCVNAENISGNYCEVAVSEQMTACEGNSLCELVISDGHDTIASANLYLVVEKSVIDGGVESETVIENLTTQVAQITADILADSYDSSDVVFDSEPTTGHDTGYVVSSARLKSEFDKYTETTDLAYVALSGSYNDLENKPSLATVATSGDYTDLSNKPSLADVATSGSYTDLEDKPDLKAVATSGDYDDLSNKPFIPSDASELEYHGGTVEAELNSLESRTHEIKVGTLTGRTSANGNVQLENGSPIMIINAWCATGDTQVHPYPSVPNGVINYSTWWFNCTDFSSSYGTRANLNVTITYLYTEVIE